MFLKRQNHESLRVKVIIITLAARESSLTNNNSSSLWMYRKMRDVPQTTFEGHFEGTKNRPSTWNLTLMPTTLTLTQPIRGH
jgi:hypothetical protein